MATALRRIRVALLTAAAFAALALALPGSASAAASCAFAANVLTISYTDGISAITTRVSGANVQVLEDGAVLPGACTTARASINNINFVLSGGIPTWTIEEPESFAPGAAVNEIDFAASDSGGGILNSIVLRDTDGDGDNYRLGVSGINYNVADGDTDVDITSTAFGSDFALVGGPGEDTFDASGGAGTGAAYDDFLFDFDPGAGNDTVTGGTQGENFDASPGDDTFDGGPGTGSDSVSYDASTQPVNIDLAATGRQSGGSLGRDQFIGIEGVDGSDFADVLRGTNGDNSMSAGDGNDLVEPRGGNDFIFGDNGTDTLTFENATGPINVNMERSSGQQTGQGNKNIDEFENLTGSRFADTIRGTVLGNRVDGRGGADRISTLEGADTVLARDGAPDTVDCGDDRDTAFFDVPGVDSPTGCESASFLTPPDRSVRLILRAADTQRIGRKGVAVKLECPDENCTVKASAKLKEPKARKRKRKAKGAATLKLKGRSIKLTAGKERTVRLKLGKKGLRRTVRALRKKGKRTVSILATATDAAGNRDREDDKVKLKAPPKPKSKK